MWTVQQRHQQLPRVLAIDFTNDLRRLEMWCGGGWDMEVSWNRGTRSHHPSLDGIFRLVLSPFMETPIQPTGISLGVEWRLSGGLMGFDRDFMGPPFEMNTTTPPEQLRKTCFEVRHSPLGVTTQQRGWNGIYTLWNIHAMRWKMAIR